MPDIPPLRLIAASQERELFARALELYGDAVVTRMLPALQLRSDELLEMFNIETSTPDLDIPPEAYADAAFGPESDRAPMNASWCAQTELELVRHYALSFAFVAIYHLFERQLLTVLDRLNHRHEGAVFGDRFKSRRVSLRT